MTERLYLDHAATTPMLASARAAMIEGMERWANPSSPHAEGRAARSALEDARARLKAALGWDHELIFTSGATEALSIALARSHQDALLVSAVGADGLVARDALFGRLGALGARCPVVAIQHVNNETGAIQPLDRLAPVVREAGGTLVVDCAQSAGKLELPEADLIAVSAHKMGGPPGIGALLVRDLVLLSPTGGQEKGYRGGTENLPAALAFAAAAEAGRGWVQRAADLRAHLDGAIEAAGGEIVLRNTPRSAAIASYRMPGRSASAQLIQFDMAGISVSTGSACSSGTLKPSRVLAALGWSEKAASETIRVSFGPETSRADIYRFVEAWKRVAP
jgi:cysteine desulfurase